LNWRPVRFLKKALRRHYVCVTAAFRRRYGHGQLSTSNANQSFTAVLRCRAKCNRRRMQSRLHSWQVTFKCLRIQLRLRVDHNNNNNSPSLGRLHLNHHSLRLDLYHQRCDLSHLSMRLLMCRRRRRRECQSLFLCQNRADMSSQRWPRSIVMLLRRSRRAATSSQRPHRRRRRRWRSSVCDPASLCRRRLGASMRASWSWASCWARARLASCAAASGAGARRQSSRSEEVDDRRRQGAGRL
jgi:hypothetical protein